jgi:hypothetical protein
MKDIKTYLYNNDIEYTSAQHENLIMCKSKFQTLNTSFFDVVKEIGYYVSFITIDNNTLRFDLCRLELE